MGQNSIAVTGHTTVFLMNKKDQVDFSTQSVNLISKIFADLLLIKI